MMLRFLHFLGMSLWIGGAFVLNLAMLVITIAINVPLNNEIKAAGEPGEIADLAAVRERFREARWVGWNLPGSGLVSRSGISRMGLSVARALIAAKNDLMATFA